MKRWALVVLMVTVGTCLYGYHKFRCMDCLLTQNNDTRFVTTPSFTVKKAAYIMVDGSGTLTSYIYLSKLDKREIAKQLRLHKPETTITQQLINSYKRPAWRRKHVVGLVLQDFKTMKSSATVGDVLRALKL